MTHVSLNSLRSKYFLGALVVIALSVALSFFVTHNASASMATNSRLNYGDAWTYCHVGNGSGPGYYAKGMVWLSNVESDYYSEAVNVSANANSVRVSIRGAVNACETTWSSDRDMYAIDVTTSYLSGMSSSTFYRGRMPAAGNYRWSSEGSKLYGDLDIRNVAVCGPASLTTGVSRQTITIEIARRQQQRYTNGSVSYTSGEIGRENVPVNVVRTCPTYNYELQPSITSFTDQASLETPRASLAVAGNVHNDGPTVSRPNPTWRFTQLIYNRTYTIPAAWRSSTSTSAAATVPCTHFTGEMSCGNLTTGTRSSYASGADVPHSGGTVSIGELEVGTQVCFVLSVSLYNETAAGNGWRHSPIRCYRVGIKPKVNVLGADLYVGRKPTGFNPVTAPTGRVVTSESTNPTGTYGSWVEYGLVPSGTVSYMTSGSATAAGTPTYRDLLTFSNAGSPPGCGSSDGCYPTNSTLPDVASRFAVSASSPAFAGGALTGRSGVYRGSGNISISGSTISRGRSVIINAPLANVTITGNITYNPGGAMSNYTQIPQVVIIAKNITIAAGVTNVDAWLIAKAEVASNGRTVDGGVLRTCDVAWSSLTASVCNQKLTVNGPVIAHRLLMLRTGGAGTGTASGDPAEVFNFRADAYLWALQYSKSGGRVTTVSTKELPPRY